jgi:hypothetical protein
MTPGDNLRQRLGLINRGTNHPKGEFPHQKAAILFDGIENGACGWSYLGWAPSHERAGSAGRGAPPPPRRLPPTDEGDRPGESVGCLLRLARMRARRRTVRARRRLRGLDDRENAPRDDARRGEGDDGDDDVLEEKLGHCCSPGPLRGPRPTVLQPRANLDGRSARRCMPRSTYSRPGAGRI